MKAKHILAFQKHSSYSPKSTAIAPEECCCVTILPLTIRLIVFTLIAVIQIDVYLIRIGPLGKFSQFTAGSITPEKKQGKKSETWQHDFRSELSCTYPSLIKGAAYPFALALCFQKHIEKFDICTSKADIAILSYKFSNMTRVNSFVGWVGMMNQQYNLWGLVSGQAIWCPLTETFTSPQ